jgi:hypothetical protein
MGSLADLHIDHELATSSLDAAKLRVTDLLTGLVGRFDGVRLSITSRIEDDLGRVPFFLATAMVTVEDGALVRAFDAEGSWDPDDRLAELDAIEHALSLACETLLPPPPAPPFVDGDDRPLPF